MRWLTFSGYKQYGCSMDSKCWFFFRFPGENNTRSERSLVDSAESWCRRLEEYQRTLSRILLARVEESRPDQITFVRDLEILIGTMGNLWETLDTRSLRADFEIDGQNSSPSLSTSVDRTGRMGRPRYIITVAQIRMLREYGFRWVDVARILEISPIALRRRTEFEMLVSDNFNDSPG